MSIKGKSDLIIVLSGGIATGKSTLARKLAETLDLRVVSSRSLLLQGAEALVTTPPDREALQLLGAKLDEETDGRWVKAGVQFGGFLGLVFDSVRRASQVDALRETGHACFHVHLTANDETSKQRFIDRGEQTDYGAAKRDPIEATLVDQLVDVADLVVDTTDCDPWGVATRVLAALRGPVPMRPAVDALVGAQFGSEGKGHVASYLAPEYHALVRVGGPNAGHTVIYNGRKVSFYHLPSGTLHNSHAAIILGPGANIRVPILMKEIALAHECGVNVRDRLYIDPQANVITDEDIRREAELVSNIGSTGQGVGAATARKVMYRGREEHHSLARDCTELRYFIRPSIDEYARVLRYGGRLFLEGTQGTGLSLHHGFYPYVTSRDTTVGGTAAEAGIAPRLIDRSIIVARTNPIRVASPPGGTSGPMGVELTWEQVGARAGKDPNELREKERTTTTKRLRRIAAFDWTWLQRTALLNGATDVALTFVDYHHHTNEHARRFEQLHYSTRSFIHEIEQVAGAPVSLVTTRFHERSIIDRRAWGRRLGW